MRTTTSKSEGVPGVAVQPVVRHGKYQGRYHYVHNGCRCPDCSKANREYQRRYSRKRFNAGIADTHGKTKTQVPNKQI